MGLGGSTDKGTVRRYSTPAPWAVCVWCVLEQCVYWRTGVGCLSCLNTPQSGSGILCVYCPTWLPSFTDPSVVTGGGRLISSYAGFERIGLCALTGAVYCTCCTQCAHDRHCARTVICSVLMTCRSCSHCLTLDFAHTQALCRLHPHQSCCQR